MTGVRAYRLVGGKGLVGVKSGDEVGKKKYKIKQEKGLVLTTGDLCTINAFLHV